MYAKHGNHCRRGRIWRKSQHQTPLITFRGHLRSRILGSLKSRRGTAYQRIINNVALESKISKERSEHVRFREFHGHSSPLSSTCDTSVDKIITRISQSTGKNQDSS